MRGSGAKGPSVCSGHDVATMRRAPDGGSTIGSGYASMGDKSEGSGNALKKAPSRHLGGSQEAPKVTVTPEHQSHQQ
jgi:hypothetical protein